LGNIQEYKETNIRRKREARKIITEEEANNLKNLDVFMGKFFIRAEERIGMRKVIEKYQEWLELAIDGYDLKKETWKNMIFKKEDKKVEDLHKIKTLKFPLDEIPELENHKESITINGSITIIEDEYEQTTIWRRQVPTKKTPDLCGNKSRKGS
jgi:hypothetical protein